MMVFIILLQYEIVSLIMLSATRCRDAVTVTHAKHGSSDTGEPPAKKPYIEDDHKKTVKKV